MFAKARNGEVKPTGSGTTIIAQGTAITGDLRCDNDIRIDGGLEGNIHSSSKVVIGASGSVKGVIHCKQADVMGTVTGDIRAAESLTIRTKATITGDIFTASLELENAAIFNGKCEMQSASVVEKTNVSLVEKSKAKADKSKAPVLETVH